MPILMAILQFVILYFDHIGRAYLAPLVFSIYILEVLSVSFTVSLIVLATKNLKKASYVRIVGLSAAFLVGMVQAFQFFSLYYTQDLLNAESVGHWSLIGYFLSLSNVLLLCSFLIASLASTYFAIDYFVKKSRSGSFILTSVAFLVFLSIGVFAVLNNNLNQIKTVKLEFAANKKSYLESFFRLAINYRTYSSRTGLADIDISFNESERENLKKIGFDLENGNINFTKSEVYTKNLIEAKSDLPLNMIVIFAESLNAQMLSVYNEDKEGLTPNIANFSVSASVFSEYYNHAFPTIIGLKGQLCSLFPRYSNGDWLDAKFSKSRDDIDCLPRYLDTNGFDTLFFGYSHPDETFFDSQMRSFGFKQTAFFDGFIKSYVPGEFEPDRGYKGNSDRQMFRGLSRFLSERKSFAKPFFVSMSTIGTHPGLDSLDGDAKFGNGDNPILNRFHNFDVQFGKFWEFFKGSKYFENTVIVLTADHAHTPSTNFIETLGKQSHLIDKIPFIVYHPLIPKSDVQVFSTSIDFAPTVIHLIQVMNGKNHFIGSSLFERNFDVFKMGAVVRSRIALVNRDQLIRGIFSLESCEGVYTIECTAYRALLSSHKALAEGRLRKESF